MKKYLPDIAIVITTYQRQELLGQLLKSIDGQKIKPKKVYVVDNENSPATQKLVESFGRTQYIGMQENTGGAGGFSRGIQEAYQAGHDWLWIMDDDVKLLPGAIAKLTKWTKQTEAELHSLRELDEITTGYQMSRKNFDSTPFYWQYRFWNHLAIPNPVAPSGWKKGETSRPMNTACFEGGLFHRKLIEKIGLPDARFFIYWDDTIYGYLASKVTKLAIVPDVVIQRTRTLDNIKLGAVRKLNSTSDMTRYYIMRNRGHMAHYLRLNGDYNPILFNFGTFLTLCKEIIRLFITKSFRSGLPRLTAGMRDGRKIRKDKTWKPYNEVHKLEGGKK
ncbi:glycosyl transferase [Alphaproteobacteria bacterium]|nr:glycosyl transferase [Alphaproteobacteria bacterium]